jgi:hypothetical protein
MRATHIIDIKHRARYIESVHQDEVTQYVEAQSTPLNTYISGIGNCIYAGPKRVQCMVGNIPTIDTPRGWDITEPKDIIVATDGSVLFGVGYHSWVIATSEEDILLTGGGPDGGDPLLMTSYRSEVGALSAGFAVLGTLARLGLINIRLVKCVCDNTSAILTSNRQPSNSIFYNTETDYDIISTIHELQEMWCNNLEINYVGSRSRDRIKGKPGLVKKDTRSSGSNDLQQGKKEVFTISDQPRIYLEKPFFHFYI